jgi:hypothetical protein
VGDDGIVKIGAGSCRCSGMLMLSVNIYIQVLCAVERVEGDASSTLIRDLDDAIRSTMTYDVCF